MDVRRVLKQSFYGIQRHAGRAYVAVSPKGRLSRFPVFALHTIAPSSSDMAVSGERLREQLTALQAAGYRSMNLETLLDTASGTHPRAEPGFAITFDDGYESVYTVALSVLEELGVSATVFLTVGFLDRKIAPPWHSTHPALVAEYRREASHFQPMTWDHAEELAAHPLIRIGSHSVNHYCLALLSRDQVQEEVRGSRQILEDRLGLPVNVFAYPFGVERYGAYSQSTEDAVRESGYKASFTSEIGRASRHRQGCVGESCGRL
jgi:peptidoglycan/xylan/chitin deacetylase (PgdA/CDA1 family)